MSGRGDDRYSVKVHENWFEHHDHWKKKKICEEMCYVFISLGKILDVVKL